MQISDNFSLQKLCKTFRQLQKTQRIRNCKNFFRKVQTIKDKRKCTASKGINWELRCFILIGEEKLHKLLYPVYVIILSLYITYGGCVCWELKFCDWFIFIFEALRTGWAQKRNEGNWVMSIIPFAFPPECCIHASIFNLVENQSFLHEL